MIQPDGNVESYPGIQKMRALNETGAHVKGYNRIVDGAGKGYINIGICMVGLDRFTSKQFYSLRSIIDCLRLNFHVEPWEIYCHNQFTTAKSCPNMASNNVMAFYHLHNYDAIEDYLLKEAI